MGIEFAKDKTLLELTRRSRKIKTLEDEDISKVAKSMLNGLKHIHRNNYVHRDIKPSNVVIGDINDLDTIKFVDFGLAIKYHTT